MDFKLSSEEISDINSDIEIKISSEESDDDIIRQLDLKDIRRKNELKLYDQGSSDDIELRHTMTNQQKSETKVQKLQSDNTKLIFENQILQNHIDQLVTSKSAAEYELKQRKTLDRENNESQENLIQNLSIENVQLKRRLNNAQETIESQAQEIAKLSKEHKELQNNTFVEIQNLKNQNQTLKRQSNTTKQNDSSNTKLLNQLQEKISNQADKIMDFQKHLAALTSLLQLEDVEADQLWIKIMDIFSSAKTAIERNTKLEAENQKLNQDLKIAIDEINNMKKPQKLPTKSTDELNITLQKLLREERKANEENSILIKKLKQKTAITNIITNRFCQLYKQVDELHAALQRKPKASGLRSLILTVMMLRHFTTKPCNESTIAGAFTDSFDSLFKSKNLNIDCKFKWLRLAYTRLIEDLVHSQADLQVSEEKRNHLKEKLIKMRSDINSNTDISSHYENKIRIMRQKIESLKSDNSAMIHPSVYEGVVKSLDDELARSSELQNKCLELEEMVADKNTKICELNRTIDELSINLHNTNASCTDLKNQMMEYDAEKEILEKLVKGKSKDILALERILSRQENYRFSTVQHLNLLVRKESQTSTTIPLGEKCIKIGRPTALGENINPAFIYN